MACDVLLIGTSESNILILLMNMKSKRTKETAVGILVNPASGRDVRRLVARASVFQNTEKCNMVYRLLGALGALGVGQVFMMPDGAGVACHIRHSLQHGRHGHPEKLPRVHFLEMSIEDGPADTLRAVELMVNHGVRTIVVMGGDGTHRLVAKQCGDVPLVTLSTGTNNAFPEIREATIAGLAAGLVATGRVEPDQVCSRGKVLRVDKNGVHKDTALVDICISSSEWIGTRALWEPATFRNLFVAFARPDAVGLSSIAGLVHPVCRWAPYGLHLTLTAPGKGMMTVLAPIAPGLLAPVGVSALKEIRCNEVETISGVSGTVALDGEREIEFAAHDRLKIWLDTKGPLIVDVSKALDRAAADHVFVAPDAGLPIT